MSADTVVPDEGDPQAWNRLAYVLNRPLSLNDPTGHSAEPPSCGTIETRIFYNDVNDAELFLAFINAYLYCQEYDYDTTIGVLRAWALGEAGEDVGSIVGERFVGELGGEVASKLVSLLQEFDDVANTEGLKTLRRFRDRLTNAIDAWDGVTDAFMEISIWGWGTLNPFDGHQYSGGGSFGISLHQYARNDNGRITGTNKLYGDFHQAGGPLNGQANNFASTVQAMAIQIVPGHGYVSTHTCLSSKYYDPGRVRTRWNVRLS